MRWSYKTVRYELKKDGLLGSAFLDEAEVEESLNEYGKAGWELVSVLETLDGVIAIFKQALGIEIPAMPSPQGAVAVDAAPQMKPAVAIVETIQSVAQEEEKTVEEDLEEDPEEAVLLDDFEEVEESPEQVEEHQTGSDVGNIRIE